MKQFYLFLVLFLSLLFVQCNKQYAFRSKVRVGKSQTPKNEPSSIALKRSQNIVPPKEATILNENEVSASSDLKFTYYNKEAISFINNKLLLSKESKEIKFDSVKHNVVVVPPIDTISTYKKWVLNLGVLSFLSYPLIIPSLFSPFLIYLSLKGRREQKARGEKVSRRFNFGLIAGIFGALILSIFLIGLPLDPTIVGGYIIWAVMLVLTLFFSWLFPKLLFRQKKPKKHYSFPILEDIKQLFKSAGSLISIVLIVFVLLAYAWFGYWVITNKIIAGFYIFLLLSFLIGIAAVFAILFSLYYWILNRKPRGKSPSKRNETFFRLTKKAFILGLISIASYILPILTFASIMAIIGGLVSYLDNKKYNTGDGWISFFAIFLGLIGLTPLAVVIVFETFEIYFIALIVGIILGLVFSTNMINKHKESIPKT